MANNRRPFRYRAAAAAPAGDDAPAKRAGSAFESAPGEDRPRPAPERPEAAGDGDAYDRDAEGLDDLDGLDDFDDLNDREDWEDWDDLDDLDDLDDSEDSELRRRLILACKTLLAIAFSPILLPLGLIYLGVKKIRRSRFARRLRSLRRGETVDLSELSGEKRFVLQHMSDRQVRAMVRRFRGDDGEGDEAEGLALDEQTKARVESCRIRRAILDDQNRRWLDHMETLLRCRMQKPKGFDGMTPQQIYQKLCQYLEARHLPGPFVSKVVPELVYYVVNGELKRPLMLVGAPGCGKTTAVKIIAEAMGMASWHFDAVTRDTSHGLFGEGKSYASPDCGDLVSGMLRTGVLNPIYHIDEPDKTSSPTTRARFQDELLSLCDRAHDTFIDNFMGFPQPLKGMMFIFTVNTTETLSPPLLDRCELIRFKDIEEPRVQDIIADYAESERRSLLYDGALELDRDALRAAVAALYSRGVHSLRQHQKLVDQAFSLAFGQYVDTPRDAPGPVVVSEAMYAEVMEGGEFGTTRRAGF